jgi:hypothetical protein
VQRDLLGAAWALRRLVPGAALRPYVDALAANHQRTLEAVRGSNVYVHEEFRFFGAGAPARDLPLRLAAVEVDERFIAVRTRPDGPDDPGVTVRLDRAEYAPGGVVAITADRRGDTRWRALVEVLDPRGQPLQEGWLEEEAGPRAPASLRAALPASARPGVYTVVLTTVTSHTQEHATASFRLAPSGPRADPGLVHALERRPETSPVPALKRGAAAFSPGARAPDP